MGNIFINKAGKDIKEQLKISVSTLKRERCEVVFMYLNMSDSAIEFAYESALEYDFFCNGCFPMSANGDFLCMQLILYGEFTYDNIVTTPEFGKVLDLIKSLDTKSK